MKAKLVISKKPFTLKGFSFTGMNIGIKNQELDFGVVYSHVPAVAHAVFTKNRFPGAPVVVGKKHIRGGKLQAIVVNSKNANACTGSQGVRDARLMCDWTKEVLKLKKVGWVLPSSTGIIGMPLNMEVMKRGFISLAEKLAQNKPGVELFAQAIMTSDAYPKWGVVKIGKATLLAVAKGAGMIEPNMATMLAYFFTDADISHATLKSMFNEAVNLSFNAITVDSDTSTSDTAVIMANGLAGKVNQVTFNQGLTSLAQYLAKEIVRDGEGAHKVIALKISKTRSERLAHAIAKSVLNSPLVKTAIYGADPNWGRIIMAVGKVDVRYRFDGNKVKIYALDKAGDRGSNKVLLNGITGVKVNSGKVEKLKKIFQSQTVHLEIEVGNGKFSKTFWGSDLGVEYVKYNSEYTT